MICLQAKGLLLVLMGCFGGLAYSQSLIDPSLYLQSHDDRPPTFLGIDQKLAEDGVWLQLQLPPYAKLDVIKKGNRLVLSSENHKPAQHLLQRLPGLDLIEWIETTSQGQGFSTVFSMRADFDYQLVQTGQALQLIISQKTQPKPTYQGEPLTLEFSDMPVRAVLEVLSQFGQINIIADDSVKGNVTMRLVNVPWDQALSLVLQTKQLSMTQEGQVLLITSENLGSDLPLRTEYIRLKYAMAEDVQALIIGEKTSKIKENSSGTRPVKNQLLPQTVQNESFKTVIETQRGRLLSERGTVAIDQRTNTLIVQDVAQSLENIHRLIDQIDVPVRQVMIEARIVSANQNFGRELGVGFAARGLDGHVQVGGSHQTLWEDRRPSNGRLGFSRDNLNVNLGVANPTGRIAFGLLNLSDLILDLELSAMQAENRGEVISSPKVLTADKQTARISSGIQIPYQEATSSGATSTSFKEASLVLEATPSITPDGKIMLKLNIKNGIPITSLGNIAIQEDAIETNVIVENGQTVVLGGIYRQTNGDEIKKVPVLGDIPVLGRLFRFDGKTDNKSELLIFITPKLVAER